MKIIDLLNKIANDEEVPYFKYRNIPYYYNFDYKEFISTQKYYRTGDIMEHYFLLEEIDMTNLNDEVEIIEEDKKIEKIGNKFHFTGCEEELANKIDEIIDYLMEKKQ